MRSRTRRGCGSGAGDERAGDQPDEALEGPFPAALLIAASGPEGRDEEVDGHRVFVVLADYLLRQGVAVLRYDKRGVGASTGDLDKASFADLVSDAATVFRYLKTRPEVNMRRLGVIGHSEGGSIAPAVAASDKDVAFVVAMAGSGLSGEFRITESQVYMAKERGASSEQQERIRVMCQQIETRSLGRLKNRSHRLH